MDAGQSSKRHEIGFSPVPESLLRAAAAPLRRWFSPTFAGLDAFDATRPALFVGNHTIYGVLDVPLMIQHLRTRHGVVLRTLGDRAHWWVPGWRTLFERMGVVVGSPDACARLMRERQHVAVFPGGGREVFRRRGEAYTLIWKQRTGFARLAIEHGYDIVPFGTVGPDDNYRILLDANDVLANPLARAWMERTGLMKLARGGDVIPPLVAGLGPIPRPQRYYFGFGERIAPPPPEALEDSAAVWALRERVAAAIEAQLAAMKALRRGEVARWSPLRRALAPFDE